MYNIWVADAGDAGNTGDAGDELEATAALGLADDVGESGSFQTDLKLKSNAEDEFAPETASDSGINDA